MENRRAKTVNMTPDETRMLRAGSIWFPLTMVVGIIVAIVAAVWTVSNERNRIDGTFTVINGRFESIANQISNLTLNVERLTARVSQPDGDYITKQQWVIECLQHEILNPNWHCAYGARKPMSWEGHTTLEFNRASN